MQTIKAILFSSLLILLFACGGKKSNDENSNTENVLSGQIQIDGSSTVYPITEAIAEEFRAVAPKVKVTVGVSGTGGGFKKFVRNEIDINNASRSIKDSEAEQCKENGISYIELSVAYDGLAVIANPQNDWLTDITVEELKKIWEPAAQGTIMKWNQIRPEWPNEEIHLFGAGTASGTYDYFTEVIIGESGASRGDYTASEDDNVLVQGISSDKFALGFFGLAYYEENKDKLKLIGVNNGSESVLPTMETVANGSYAPLSRPIFIYVTNKSSAREEVKTFINFYLDNVASISEEVGYIPLPEAEINKQKEKFNSFTASSNSAK